jgi:hypothetical protein
MKRNVVLAALSLGLITASCSFLGLGPTRELASGDYPLHAFNGDRIPADLGPVAPKGPDPSQCHIFVTDGSLHIDASRATFAYEYEARNGCTQESLSEIGLSGTYRQYAQFLVFRVLRVDGQVTFGGKVSGSSIRMDVGPGEALEFSR